MPFLLPQALQLILLPPSLSHTQLWNLDELSYVETLFGHQEPVLGIDSLHRERAVSCGGRDRTVRLWKIVDESQLVYNSPNGTSLDCVAMISERGYISGDQNG